MCVSTSSRNRGSWSVTHKHSSIPRCYPSRYINLRVFSPSLIVDRWPRARRSLCVHSFSAQTGTTTAYLGTHSHDSNGSNNGFARGFVAAEFSIKCPVICQDTVTYSNENPLAPLLHACRFSCPPARRFIRPAKLTKNEHSAETV